MGPAGARALFGKAAVVFAVMALAACASGTVLKWNQVDAGALMQTEAGRQAYHAIRFETYGPRAEQIFGYVLYKEGVEVVTGDGVPVLKMGKKTLREVMTDYENVKRSRMYSGGSNLIVREVLRKGSVVGYTATDLNLDVQLWDISEGDGPAVLRLVYKDLRGDTEIPDPRRQRRMGL